MSCFLTSCRVPRYFSEGAILLDVPDTLALAFLARKKGEVFKNKKGKVLVSSNSASTKGSYPVITVHSILLLPFRSLFIVLSSGNNHSSQNRKVKLSAPRQRSARSQSNSTYMDTVLSFLDMQHDSWHPWFLWQKEKKSQVRKRRAQLQFVSASRIDLEA